MPRFLGHRHYLLAPEVRALHHVLNTSRLTGKRTRHSEHTDLVKAVFGNAAIMQHLNDACVACHVVPHTHHGHVTRDTVPHSHGEYSSVATLTHVDAFSVMTSFTPVRITQQYTLPARPEQRYSVAVVCHFEALTARSWRLAWYEWAIDTLNRDTVSIVHRPYNPIASARNAQMLRTFSRTLNVHTDNRFLFMFRAHFVRAQTYTDGNVDHPCVGPFMDVVDIRNTLRALSQFVNRDSRVESESSDSESDSSDEDSETSDSELDSASS